MYDACCVVSCVCMCLSKTLIKDIKEAHLKSKYRLLDRLGSRRAIVCSPNTHYTTFTTYNTFLSHASQPTQKQLKTCIKKYTSHPCPSISDSYIVL